MTIDKNFKIRVEDINEIFTMLSFVLKIESHKNKPLLNDDTKEELYVRLRPALNAKLQELRRLNYPNITEEDIWSYLSEVKWTKSKGLMLSDIVSDIIHVDNRRLNSYV